MSSMNEEKMIANKNTGGVPAKTTKDGPYVPMWGVNTNKIRQQYWYRRTSAPFDIKPHGYNLMSVNSSTGVKTYTRVEKSADYAFIGMNTGKESE